jgi:hypothetical protein
MFLSAPAGSPALRRWATKLDGTEPMTRRKAEKLAAVRQTEAMSQSRIVALVVCGE